jgi:hypothetical protein
MNNSSVEQSSVIHQNNHTISEMNMVTNIKAPDNQIVTGGENLASPVKAPVGENESPGPISSMKFGSDVRGEVLSNTEQLDPNNNNNGEMSGIFQQTFEIAKDVE